MSLPKRLFELNQALDSFHLPRARIAHAKGPRYDPPPASPHGRTRTLRTSKLLQASGTSSASSLSIPPTMSSLTQFGGALRSAFSTKLARKHQPSDSSPRDSSRRNTSKNLKHELDQTASYPCIQASQPSLSVETLHSWLTPPPPSPTPSEDRRELVASFPSPPGTKAGYPDSPASSSCSIESDCGSTDDKWRPSSTFWFAPPASSAVRTIEVGLPPAGPPPALPLPEPPLPRSLSLPSRGGGWAVTRRASSDTIGGERPDALPVSNEFDPRTPPPMALPVSHVCLGLSFERKGY